jgi:hypothetical protein
MVCVFLPPSQGRAQAGAHVAIAAPRVPIPFEKWPLWAKMIRLVRTGEDSGVGDTVRRTIGDANSKAFQIWYQTTFGKSCGCARRHGEWNQQYRY